MEATTVRAAPCPALGDAAATLRSEGAEYATCLVQRIRAGTADAEALASLVTFMHDGAILLGLCEELHRAIREGAAS